MEDMVPRFAFGLLQLAVLAGMVERSFQTIRTATEALAHRDYKTAGYVAGAIVLSVAACVNLRLDFMELLFQIRTPSPFGYFLTALSVAGGSQGLLRLRKTVTRMLGQ